MLSVLKYLDRAGSSPFAAWLRSLDAAAAAKVTTALRHLELGHFSNVKGVGAGCSITASISGLDIGSISAKMARPVVILLGGGTKKRQDSDIAAAHERWADYKKRKAQEK